MRRFIAQIKRNWFIPYAAMSLRGHVAVSFNVHKDGSITDVAVVGAERDRRVQQLVVQRDRGLEPHAAAPAGVPVGQGVLHRHVLLQRDAALTLMAMPTRTQQLGWLLLLGALVVWALATLAGLA